MKATPKELKNRISPDLYYARYLKGHFGSHTGNGWHNWSGLCPFHADKKTGSFVVNRNTGAFKCFSCGTGGGDILSFHMNISKLSFNAACEHLEELYP